MFDRGLPYFYDIRRIIFALLDVDKDLISCIGGCNTKENRLSVKYVHLYFYCKIFFDCVFTLTHIANLPIKVYVKKNAVNIKYY